MDQANILKEKLILSGINNYPTDSNMLIEYLCNRVEFLNKNAKKNINIKNWRLKRDDLLHKLKYCIGLDNLPKKLPLKSKIVGKIEREDYILEKIILESFKKINIAAHLYLPKKADFPTSSILHVPGHWMENSKMEPDPQRFCIGLVRLGFVVLSIDPWEQGERRTCWKNHGHLETLSLGITQIGMMIYENTIALDYLQSREEVDRKRLGMTGTSGGGANTIYTTAFENRIKASASICYAITYPGLINGHIGYNWNGGTDLCNQIPFVVNTLTFSHLLAFSAPRPVMIVSAEEDLNFPAKSAKEVFKESKPYFDLYGHNLINHTIVPGEHGLGKEAREAVYGFFLKHLMNTGKGTPKKEPKIEIEEVPYENNYIDSTADKNRAQSFKEKKNLPTYVFNNKSIREIGKPLKEMLLKKYNEKHTKTKLPNDINEWSKRKSRNIDEIKNILALPSNHNPLNPRIVSGVESPGYFVERILFDSEKGIKIPGLLFLPDNWKTPNNIWICLDDLGKNGFMKNSFFNSLIEKNQAIFSIDLRGQGESLAMDFEVSTLSYMIDRNMLSQRIYDVLRAVEYISLRATTGIQINKQKIFCYGKNTSAITALFAGVIDDRIDSIFIENQIASYKSLLYGEFRFSPSIFIYDILSHFDIDDIAALAFPKILVISNSVDKNKKELSLKDLYEEYKYTRLIYNKFNKSRKFILDNLDEEGIKRLIDK